MNGQIRGHLIIDTGSVHHHVNFGYEDETYYKFTPNTTLTSLGVEALRYVLARAEEKLARENAPAFKRGDRVRIVGNPNHPDRRPGDLGVVVGPHRHSFFDFDVELDGIGSINTHYFKTEELQLVHHRYDSAREGRS